MSICSEAYWFYFNGDQAVNYTDKQADPTETIVEWLVEMKFGQQDIFTYNYNNIDSKNTVKAISCITDLENYSAEIQIIRQITATSFAGYIVKVKQIPSDIVSPPPRDFTS